MTHPDQRPSLTARQADYLLAIQIAIEKTGLPPSTRELAAACGVASLKAVDDAVRILRRKGYVTWEPHKSRTLQLCAGQEQGFVLRLLDDDQLDGAAPGYDVTTSRGVRLRRVWWDGAVCSA